MLYDAQFLRELDEQQEHTTYVRIQALTLDERPVDTLQGRTTSGSINLDGKSAIRRSCSLSFLAELKDINDYYWTFKRKFRVEIGLENKINKKYPSIIWFPMGVFFITSFSSTVGTNNCSISIQGKDKMCLLNGELGGLITAETDFGSVDETDIYGETTNSKLEIKDIIENLIYTYAQEPLSNILIQDLDLVGLEQLDYKYDKPLYLIRPANSNFYSIPVFEDNPITIYINGKEAALITDSTKIEYDSLLHSGLNLEDNATQFTFTENGAVKYCAAKISYGEAVGYRTCPLVYAGDLIAKAGDTVTSVLDKIVKMLGEFEYFYDTDGRFIFRRKRSFINTVWTPQVKTQEGDSYYLPYYYATPYVYTFKDNKLITNISNQPKLDSIKNDYTVWGERTGTTGGKIPIHSRYAIDKKPVLYVSVKPQNNDEEIDAWTTANDGDQLMRLLAAQSTTNQDLEKYIKQLKIHYGLDWRELIYQMSIEYRRYNRSVDNTTHRSELEQKDYTMQLAWRNPFFYSTGHTGYEQYYTDFEGFWRQLYCPYDKLKPVEELTDVIYYETYDIPDNGTIPKDIYIRGVYRPNSMLIPSYPLKAKNQIRLQENEVLLELENETKVWVINIKQLYYRDTTYHGFNLPINNANYYLGQDVYNYFKQIETVTVPNAIPWTVADLDSVYTLAEPLLSQQIYSWDNRYPEDNLIMPIMDKFDYLPITYSEQLYNDLYDEYWNTTDDSNYKISNFYVQDYSNASDPYVKITESYNGSKYSIYTLDKLNESAQAIKNDLNVIRNLIAELIENNQNIFAHWAQLQNKLNDIVGLESQSIIGWLDYVTQIFNGGLTVVNHSEQEKANGQVIIKLLILYLVNYEPALAPILKASFNIDSFADIFDVNSYPDVASRPIPEQFLYLVLHLYYISLSKSTQLYLDLNGDGQIDTADALLFWRFVKNIDMHLSHGYDMDDVFNALKLALGIQPDNTLNYDASLDINNDNQITTEDALYIYRYVLGLIDSLPFNNPIVWNNNEFSSSDITGLLIFFLFILTAEQYEAILTAFNYTPVPFTSISQLPEDFWLMYQNSPILSQLLQVNSVFDQLKILLILYYQIIYINQDVLIASNQIAPQYILLTDLVQKILPHKSENSDYSIHDAWERCLIYDSTNYYPIHDLQCSNILTSVYFDNNIPKKTIDIVPYSLHGEPEYLSSHEQKLSYYTLQFEYYNEDTPERKWWNKKVYEEPYNLNFWFDFLEVTNSEIGAYAVSEIGDRPIVVNETNLKSIFYREIPKIIIMSAADFAKLTPQTIQTGYSYILFPDGYDSFFSISARGLSIKNRIDDLVYQHTYCNQQLNLTSIPIYYLDVNSRIKIVDAATQLSCDCAIQSISYSLNYNGTMSINTAKIQPNSIFEREE